MTSYVKEISDKYGISEIEVTEKMLTLYTFLKRIEDNLNNKFSIKLTDNSYVSTKGILEEEIRSLKESKRENNV